MIPERRFRLRVESDPDVIADPDFPNMVEVFSHITVDGHAKPNPAFEIAEFTEKIIHNCEAWSTRGGECQVCGRKLHKAQ
jgi:hypothetical protein